MQNLIIVGPMGAGKSTIGRLLAKELRLDFKDSDKEIEVRTGANIPWIFDVEGEQGFRDREQAVLADLCQEQGLVIATGGGAVMRPENRQALRAGGRVVSAEDLLEQAWDEHADPFTNTVRMTVMTLRRKLGDPPVIHTVRGAGYRLGS